MLSHFTPSQIIKDYMRRTRPGAVFNERLYEIPKELAETLENSLGRAKEVAKLAQTDIKNSNRNAGDDSVRANREMFKTLFLAVNAACPPYLDAKTCERRARALSAAYTGDLDRATLNDKARAMLNLTAFREHPDGHPSPTVNLVSLLRTSPRMGDMSFPKNKFELKMKDVASTLKFKK
ncbi:hypothetical protein Tcan_11696 [Toxocara canis]|uniref:Uncharacterized protein n=2 Tax=Toxocara canis TaxID=6265 RepID=A0A0B2V1Y5_TOXCA|nr:hypothetical protein Tcan_11696 [Toxocara canis]VDM43783.1 unnamed protein product [Toxocara canis]